MKKIILLLLLLFSANSFCGELYMILYKGKVSSIITNKAPVAIPTYKRYKLEKTMSLEFKSKAVFIIYSTDNRYLDHVDSYTAVTPYNSIVANLKPMTSSNFLTVVNGYDELRETGEKTKATVRAGSKGLNNKKSNLKELEEYIFPTDSTRVIGSSVSLQWKTKDKLLGGVLKVTDDQTGKEILSKPIDQEGSHNLDLPAAGWYSWEIISEEENNKIIETNSFKKLSAGESQKELAELQSFKDSISAFLQETQDYLMESYLEQHLLEN